MPRKKQLQTNFSAGELAPDLSMRQDTEQYANGAKSLRNRRCLIGGGTKRRPGSWYFADLAGDSRIEAFIVTQDIAYVMVFGDGRVDAYRVDMTDGGVTAAGSVTSAPWTGSIFTEMDYEQSGDTAFLTHADMPPQVLTRTGASSWAVANFAFYTSGPRTEQPYYKVAAADVTLTPSALTGSITLEASGDVFIADHVGAIVRYLKREIEITAVTDANTATGTVLETLPTTQRLTVTSSAEFTVGESVSGADTDANGIVTAIPGATTIDVVISDGLTNFSNESLVGPNGYTTISGTASTTPAAVADWDEQLFGAVHGYPSCVALHRNRLLFAGHPAVPDALIGSKINNLYSFDVDDGSDADAIFETVGDAGASEIVQLHSAEQLLVLTDHGPYYCPESATQPFRPSSIAFFPFGSPWPITKTAKARAFDDGVLFVSGSLVIKARPTGNQAQQWAADEVSLLSSHLISNPERIVVTSNFADGPERYAVLQNDDGTLAVMQLVETQKIRNFTPWDTDGTYTSGCAIGKFLYVTTRRLIAENTRYLLELFDQDLTLDAATEYASLADVESRYGAMAVNVVVGSQYHLGTLPLEITNPPPGPYTVGLYYNSVLETLPPALDDAEGPVASDYVRILDADVYVIGSQRFAADGYALSAYQVSDAVDEPPPEKNGFQKFQFLGWERDPTIVFDQPDPLPLDIMAVRTTVAFT